MSVTVRLLAEAPAGAADAWDRFVHATEAATFFHKAGWAGVIERSFGHPTHYAFAEQDGAIVGVLPLARMRTLLFGDVLASTPFCVYGGPVAVTEAAHAALVSHAVALRKRLGAPALEFRRIEAADDGFAVRPPLYFTFRKPIHFTGDAEKDLTRNVPVKRRSEIRKGYKRGATSIANRDVATLYAVYAESVRNLGTPVFPRRYFDALIEAFPDATSIVTVLHEGAAVASALSFHFRDQVLPYYVGGTRASRACAGSDVMFYEVMRRAGLERGARLYDFGRSKLGTGAFEFKRHYGFEPEPLHYCYDLAPGARIPENNPNNPKYRAFIALWKRLPLWLANRLGPPLVRGLG